MDGAEKENNTQKKKKKKVFQTCQSIENLALDY